MQTASQPAHPASPRPTNTLDALCLQRRLSAQTAETARKLWLSTEPGKLRDFRERIAKGKAAVAKTHRHLYLEALASEALRSDLLPYVPEPTPESERWDAEDAAADAADRANDAQRDREVEGF